MSPPKHSCTTAWSIVLRSHINLVVGFLLHLFPIVPLLLSFIILFVFFFFKELFMFCKFFSIGFFFSTAILIFLLRKAWFYSPLVKKKRIVSIIMQSYCSKNFGKIQFFIYPVLRMFYCKKTFQFIIMQYKFPILFRS